MHENRRPDAWIPTNKYRLTRPNSTLENFSRLVEVARSAMAAAAEEQELVVPEADECSRWAVTCLLGFAGVSVLYIASQVPKFVQEDPLMTLLLLLLLFLGLFLSALSSLFLMDRYMPGLNPEGQIRFVDKVLLLY